MRVTPADRTRFERQVAMLQAVDGAADLGIDEVREVLVADDAEPPELELHRRARALGMARPVR